jgi:hypothetical protein
VKPLSPVAPRKICLKQQGADDIVDRTNELLQDQVIPNLQEGREWCVASYDGTEVLKPRVQAAKDVEDEDPVVDR